MRIRLHALFIVFAIATLYLAWLGERAGASGLTSIAWLSLAILFLASLLHGFGHYLVVDDDEPEVDIVLGPFGELVPVPTPYDPRSELALHAAGPLMNLSVVLITLAMLLIAGEQNLLGLLHPLAPLGLVEGSRGIVVLKLTLWINWLLLLTNGLIPAYPFDGGRILRAAIWGIWPEFGRRWAGFVVYSFAQLIAIGLVIAAIIFREHQFHGVLPIWLALVLLSVVVFFSARQELARDVIDLPLDGVAEAASELESESEFRSSASISPESTHQVPRPTMGRFSRWLEQRRQARLARQRQLEADDDAKVDDILRRLHLEGIERLSQEERAILMRVSNRLRNRRENGIPN